MCYYGKATSSWVICITLYASKATPYPNTVAVYWRTRSPAARVKSQRQGWAESLMALAIWLQTGLLGTELGSLLPAPMRITRSIVAPWWQGTTTIPSQDTGSFLRTDTKLSREGKEIKKLVKMLGYKLKTASRPSGTIFSSKSFRGLIKSQ